MRVQWTPAMERRLRRLYAAHSAQECADAMGVGYSAVVNHVAVLGLAKSPEWVAQRTRQRWAEGRHEASRAKHFRKGEAAYNKGRPQAEWMPAASRRKCRATQFRKGSMSGAAQRNWVPLGTEKVRDGLLVRKLTDDQSVYPAARWQPVSRLVWEAAHGPVPEGHICVFRPGMKTLESARITADRLEVITLAENMRRNSYLTRYPKEMADLIRLRGALNRKINNRTKA